MASQAAKVALAGAGIGILGYAVYRYWYLPNKMRDELNRQAAILAAQKGISQTDALAMLGGAACQAIGVKYGIPPQGSSAICSKAAQMASALVQQIPTLIGNIGVNTGTALSAIGAGGASGLMALGNVPISLTKNIVGSSYGGVKTIVGDAYGGVKTVINDIGSGLEDIGDALKFW